MGGAADASIALNVGAEGRRSSDAEEYFCPGGGSGPPPERVDPVGLRGGRWSPAGAPPGASTPLLSRGAAARRGGGPGLALGGGALALPSVVVSEKKRARWV